MYMKNHMMLMLMRIKLNVKSILDKKTFSFISISDGVPRDSTIKHQKVVLNLFFKQAHALKYKQETNSIGIKLDKS